MKADVVMGFTGQAEYAIQMGVLEETSGRWLKCKGLCNSRERLHLSQGFRETCMGTTEASRVTRSLQSTWIAFPKELSSLFSIPLVVWPPFGLSVCYLLFHFLKGVLVFVLALKWDCGSFHED